MHNPLQVFVKVTEQYTALTREKKYHVIILSPHSSYSLSNKRLRPAFPLRCAVPPDILRSAISFSITSNILIRYIYTSHSPFNVRNASLVAFLHGCAVAGASCATKEIFAQCRIFLARTLIAAMANFQFVNSNQLRANIVNTLA